ncbi:NAD kinase [Pseudoclavibacter chungangensis]|uniref:NAD kinase n=1 Tax=Pseudoclavibacter chungangensis TaxID=587635 RepID=A0A7J5BN35_9MICO|nr:NAD kinase [Pseudoclavibacter chungangensis]KAB1653283.1 NAD kinase [Pseudoclavibacter chungangensis]NYJ66972.1 NAD+ kinase [Pseudoclavibacter chungangensis]
MTDRDSAPVSATTTRRILLVGHTGRADAVEAAFRVAELLADEGVQPVLERDTADELRAIDAVRLPGSTLVLGEDCDLDEVEIAVVLGGDGTILRAAEVVRPSGVPIIGVNLGHVGFLAESERDSVAYTLRRVLDRDYTVEERMALSLRVEIGDAVIAEDWALNDASIEKADRAKMVEVVIEVDDQPLSAFGCDGVIFSTPTGSTAYSFSAGGPIVWPTVEALLLVPISAHALFSRPIVVAPTSVLAVELNPRGPGGIMWCDGRRQVVIPAGARVVATRSPHAVRLARLHLAPFSKRLVDKFRLPTAGWRGTAAT